MSAVICPSNSHRSYPAIPDEEAFLNQLEPKFRDRFSRVSHAVRFRRAQVQKIFERRPIEPASASWLTRRSAAVSDLFRRTAGRWTSDPSVRGTHWWDSIYLAVVPWIQTRKPKELLLGLPALLALLLIISAALIITGHRPSITRNSQLLRQAELAMAGKDFSRAAIAYQRLLQVGDQDPATRFGLARCWSALGERQQADQLLTALAPDDSTGYLPAQRVRAFLLMQLPDATAAQLALARTHLQLALAASPEDPDANGMLATLLMRQGDNRGARDHFAKAAVQRPDMSLNAAILSQKIDDGPATADYARRAETYFQSILQTQGGTPPVDAVLGLAQALCLEKQFGEALTIVQERAADPARSAKAQLDICNSWQSELDAQGGAHDIDRLRITRTVLALEPDAHAWQLRLLDLAANSSAVRPAALTSLDQLIAGNHAGAEVCFFQGMEAWAKDDLDAARQLLERSLALQPNHSATANNLASAWLAGKQADPARALALADQALSGDLQNPFYHETRGEALLALRRWADAAAEFEIALPKLSQKHNARQNLAQAYQHLGEDERAREQQRLAALDQ